ncbi:hypothetical protein AB4Z43_32945 [Mesorhizobium sp. 2RAF45]|uniref:hypothetical protein n=1 Tax=Mesorhizobium sp. 2RAF45 TaxID=3233001 RepID=UPI003F951762
MQRDGLPNMRTVPFTREQIIEGTRRAVIAFAEEMGRAPNEREQALLVACLTRYFIAPDASQVLN